MSDKKRPCGHDDCSTSTGICDRLTFGRGELDEYGYWSIPCGICARDFERRSPEYGECWPSKAKTEKAEVTP